MPSDPAVQPPPLIWESDSSDFPPRCLRCAYVLRGLQAGRCPECGLQFDLANSRTFTTKPPLIGWKFWLPGLLLSIGGGIAASAILLSMGNWGWALWFSVPFAGGAVLGYRVRTGIFMFVLAMLILVTGLIMGALSMDIAGVYCGLALAGIFLGPVLVGTALGALLRVILKATNFSQRWHLPVWLLLAMPLACGVIEGRPRQSQPNETISTAAVLPMDAQRAFDAIMFYEEVTHAPPLILRIGLAHPLFTRGSSQRVGDVKTCIYNKGHITKRITEVVPGRRLAFEVIEQDIGYEIDVRLIGGAFEFQPLADGSTQVTLTTEYEPLLRPRWCWRPFERFAVHTLHGHVLEGMRRRAEGHEPDAKPPQHVSAGALP